MDLFSALDYLHNGGDMLCDRTEKSTLVESDFSNEAIKEAVTRRLHELIDEAFEEFLQSLIPLPLPEDVVLTYLLADFYTQKSQTAGVCWRDANAYRKWLIKEFPFLKTEQEPHPQGCPCMSCHLAAIPPM